MESDPRSSTDRQLLTLFLRTRYKPGSAQHALRMIRVFQDEWHTGDLVIICKGYNARSRQVDLYGFARVEGDLYFDHDSKWWRLKRRAIIQLLEENIPKAVFTATLGLRSSMRTIHQIEEDSLSRFMSEVRQQYGISLEV